MPALKPIRKDTEGSVSIRTVSRLPPAMQPLWPIVKRLHRLASLWFGVLGRFVSPLAGSRGLPRRAKSQARDTAAGDPGSVQLHPARPSERLSRIAPAGEPPQHTAFTSVTDTLIRDQFVLEIRDGLVLGDYAATITSGGVLDFETSPYFGITDWREHPLYLRGVLPAVERFEGTLGVLATRGGSANYYHFLFDVLPRWALIGDAGLAESVDGIYVPTETRYQRELLAISGLDKQRIVPTAKHSAVRADRLLVPSLPNVDEYMPPWIPRWLREQLPSGDLGERPRRIYVTRGSGPNTRRLTTEEALWPELDRRGFVRIDPGTLSVQEQIDSFAAADVVVGIHGAALSNLAFSPPGVRVLELFAPRYTKPPFWVLVDGIPGSTYRYLVGEGRRLGKEDTQGIQDDITLDPTRILAAVDDLIG